MTKKAIDFSSVKRAGIAVTHFALLCGCSRVSASRYLTNTPARKLQPRGLYRTRVIQVLKLIDKALAEGRLPLPRVGKGERYTALLNALKG
jgi:hypothetical protein